MTSRKVTATEWIVNENKLSQAPLVAWHVLSSIWVHFGTWGLIFLVKNQFSHIFPASAWSPFLAVNLTAKQARLGQTAAMAHILNDMKAIKEEKQIVLTEKPRIRDKI